MIKLKIGDNYLITSARDELINTYVPFMMGCFFQHNCVAIAHPVSTLTETVQEYIKAVKESGATNFFLLVDDVSKKQISVRNYVSPMMKVFIDDLRASIPNIKIKVIDITKKEKEISENRFTYLTVIFTNLILLSFVPPSTFVFLSISLRRIEMRLIMLIQLLR